MQHASPKLLAVAAISALLTALPGVANTNGPAASLDMVIKGQCDIPTSYSGSPGTIVGNYLYLGGDGLTIVDIATPTNPHAIGHLPGDGAHSQPLVSGPLAYQILQDRFRVIDITVPNAPTEIGAVSNVAGLYLRKMDHYAIVSGQDLLVIDLSLPEKPNLVGRMENVRTVVELSGKFGYVARTNGLGVLDLSDPTQPHLLKTIPVAEDSVAVRGQYGNRLYVRHKHTTANGFGPELLVYDISQPEQPKLLGPIASSPDIARQDGPLLPFGNRLVTSAPFDNSATVFSTDGTTNASLLGSFYMIPPGGTRNVALVAANDQYAFVQAYSASGATGVNQIYLIDIGTPATHVPVNHFTSARVVGIHNDAALLSTWGHLLYDNTNSTVTDEDFPPLVSVNLENPAGDLVIPTNKPSTSGFSISGFCVAGERGIAIIDHRTFALYEFPANGRPKVVSSRPLEDFGATYFTGGSAMAANASNAFISDTINSTIWRLDISDPSHPAIVSSYAAPDTSSGGGHYKALAMRGDRLYASSGNTLEVFDVSGPTNLIRRSALESGPTPAKLLIGETNLFAIGSPLDGISVFSLADPVNPRRSSVYSGHISHTSGALVGRYLYASRSDYGMDIYDVSNPAAIVRVGGNSTFPAPGLFTDGRILVTTSITESSFRAGDTYVFPLFEDSPAYTPLAPVFRDGGFQFELRGIPGTHARIQRGSHLGRWEDWHTVNFEGAPVFVTDLETTAKTGFYRIAAP